MFNQLIYGLRDRYVALLRFLGVNNHKVVALTVLESFVRNGSRNFWFQMKDEDVREVGRTHDNQLEINSQVEGEIMLMGRVDTSYTSALRFLPRIQQRYDERQGRSLPLVPENAMKTSFIRIDQKGIDQLKRSISRSSDLPSTMAQLLSRKAVNARRNGTLEQSFLTDGVQVILLHEKRYERIDWVTERQEKFNRDLVNAREAYDAGLRT